MTFTNYPFHKPANNRNSKRLFMPVNDFSFSTFTVPMKFQQPKSAVATQPPKQSEPSARFSLSPGERASDNTNSNSLPKTITGTATLSYLKRFIR